jgi:RNA polymerase sigma-70 factor (ECF subfamily)
MEREDDRGGTGADRQGDAPPPARALPNPGGDRGTACPCREAGDTDWQQIDLLYQGLEAIQPSPVVTLNRAVAVSKSRGPQAALDMIEPLAPRLSGYFHFFGVKGGLLMQLGRHAEARAAFDRAISLANTAAEAAHIRMHLDRLAAETPQTSGMTSGKAS